jgi:hypothetical protein
MLTRITKWSIVIFCALFAACAVITVNVYFPEKDVKQAYKSLDEMLLKQSSDQKQPADKESGTNPSVEGQPPAEQPADIQAPAPGDKKEEVKPQSSIWGEGLGISLVTEAAAAENLADQLAIETSSMPEVLKAYDQMRARLPQINALLDNGAAGINKQGLISIRDKAKSGGSDSLVNAENDSRKAVITGMAQALQKITERQQPGAKVNMGELMKKAAATIADVKREEAKAGWWVELANGRWVQK